MEGAYRPGWRDSRRDDRRRCATDASCPRSSRTRTPAGRRRWSTCTPHPRRSSPSGSTLRATSNGTRSTLWKSWALSLHLEDNATITFISRSETIVYKPIITLAGTAFHSSQKVMKDEVTNMMPGMKTVVK